MGKTDLLKQRVNELSEIAGQLMRKTITEHLMTLTFPPGNIILLGKDVTGVYPEHLKLLQDPGLSRFIAVVDPTQNSVLQSGAVDWSDLKERLHFISDLFRCYHHKPELFTPAFTPEQIQWIQAGKAPDHFDW